MEYPLIPEDVIRIKNKYKLTIKVVEDPATSKELDYLNSMRIMLVGRKTELFVDLLYNHITMSGYEVISINYKNCNYSDLNHDDLLIVIEAILKGNIKIKKHALLKNKIYITDGNEKILFTPRTIY
jgi:hypothetical protein